MEEKKIKVAILEQHTLERLGFIAILQSIPSLELMESALENDGTFADLKKSNPDLVLLGLGTLNINTMKVLEHLLKRVSGSKLLIVASKYDVMCTMKALESGVLGCLLKKESVAEIAHAVRSVVQGEHYISLEVAQQLAISKLTGTKTLNGEVISFDKLSKRELEVALMLINGMTIKQISEKLLLELKTVGTYRYRVLKKMGITNDVQLTLLAVREGLIDKLSVNIEENL